MITTPPTTMKTLTTPIAAAAIAPVNWSHSPTKVSEGADFHQDLGFNVNHSKLIGLIQRSFTLDSRTLTYLAIGLAVYALVELVESVGLWLAKRWGEYFAMVATSIFLPYEVYDLTVKITWLRVVAFVVNLLLVIYLVWTKRLFGVRGGKRAYEARLRTESVIEVEQAALAAASPGQPAKANGLARQFSHPATYLTKRRERHDVAVGARP